MRQTFGIALGGMVALAAGMGLGRFLYTPVLPLMGTESGLSPAAAGLIAGANFAGYLAGALLASLPGIPGPPKSWLLGALAVSMATTGLMAMTELWWVWSLLRLVAGAASAVILIFASSLVTTHLAARGRAGLSSIHFAGVGAGILLSALISSPWMVPEPDWQLIWTIASVATLAALGLVALLVPGRSGKAPDSGARGGEGAGLWRLIAGYGALGFGYIVTATFLVAILAESGASRGESAVIWALVGIAAIPSIALWRLVAAQFGTIRAFQAAMLLEALGVALSIAESQVAVVLAAVLLGGTFMGLTALGLQEAARRSGGDGRAVMAVMTASFGTGQMLGPLLAGWMRDATGSYALPSLIAAAVLIGGAAIVHPLARPQAQAG
ncbi:MAG: YbfB/YjiJ family MFS transporter [Pseudomonadota bacterium]